MNFKTPISTTREQSERLLAMGLKPETADMCYNLYFASAPPEINNYGADLYRDKRFIPSWSLARLLEMIPHSIEQMDRPNADLNINADDTYWFVTYEELGYDVRHQVMKRDLFKAVIDMMEWLVQNNHFNKEYLIGNP